ncbi:MAG: M23 family metallopeptidase [Methylobacteriaceae bacterium]|nr:M23 family metallopeptidase [Methylobacteriaceae bacterium]
MVERRNERLHDRADIGVEPPIDASGPGHTRHAHRRVSLKWLAGTILTGLLGTLLVGAAIYSALDQESNFAEAPTPAVLSAKDSSAEGTDNPRKGDRILQSVDIIAAKQTFKTPTNIKLGNKEVVRIKEFTRVATTLTLTNTGFADEVPPFDALKLMTDAQNPVDTPPDPGPAPDDADVSFVPRVLAETDAAAPTKVLSLEEVEAQVGEELKTTLAAGDKPGLSLPPQLLLMRTSRAGISPTMGLPYAPMPELSAPFDSIEVRMVAENVTVLPRNVPERDSKERLVIIPHNQSLEDVLKANGVPRDDAHAIAVALSAKRGEPIGEGQRLRLTFADVDGLQTPQIARISVYKEDKAVATVAINDAGGYVPVTTDAGPSRATTKPGTGADTGYEDSPGGLRLYNSLYESALKQDIPRPIIDDLVRIFANDVDFQRTVHAGDSFEAFYADPEEPDGRAELLYASITSRGEAFRYYRFQTPDDGLVDFYDPSGRSTRKFLIRKPVAEGIPTSPFGWRVHPILGYTKFHSGQDWAGAVGTQIFAAGTGTVIKAGWDSGYGRRIEIQHANGYVTTYSHMSGFARGIAEGVRVRQGQVIGYMGATGLATGPHLHYEILINGRFVDPMAIKLARTREFDGKLLADFNRERERIDGLMAKAPNAGASAVVADVMR